MRAISAVLTAVGALLILYFPALWLWQVYRWLETSLWIPLPAILVFQKLSALRILAAASNDPVARDNSAILAYIPELPRPEWLDHPREWLGLHKLVMWILENAHIGFIAAILGCVCLLVAAWLQPRRPRMPADA